MKKVVWLLLVVFVLGGHGLAQTSGSGIWISRGELASLSTSGSAWNNLKGEADGSCGSVDLSNQDQRNNVCILAKALVFARTEQSSYRSDVIAALQSLVTMGVYSGRALALGRELGAYVIAADLIELKIVNPSLDNLFRTKIRALLTAPTTDGPSNLIDCHEDRPNNWGTHCGGARAAVAAYLGDTAELARVAKVFKGWLGDRTSYAGFRYGDLSWQCDSSAPVGINRKNCSKSGHSIDGVLPDDQRRGGGFTWPPPQENYVYEGLQGALMQAVILKRAGYDVFGWQDQALLRAFQWLHNQANFPAEGDDTWQPHVVNFYYGTNFPAPVPTYPGKNVGWTDWTHSGTFNDSPADSPVLSVSPGSLSFGAVQGGPNPTIQSIQVSNTGTGTLSWTASKTQSWLTLSPSSGSGPATISVSASVGGLSAGTYADTITVAASGAQDSPRLIAVTLTVSSSPNAVTSLSLSPNPVEGGLSAIGTVTISSPAPSGGKPISLSSNSAAVTVPSSMTIAAGQSTGTFVATTSSVLTQQQATVTATGSDSVQALLLVNPSLGGGTSCATSSNSVWGNTSFPPQSGLFTAQFDATPNANNMDGVMGLSAGSVTGYSDLAVSVRFYTNGRIEARNGASYGATTVLSYTAGSSYHFRLVVNVSTRTYDAYVTPPGGPETLLASQFAFRTEQSLVSSLSNWSILSQIGTHQVCNFALLVDGPATTGGIIVVSVTPNVIQSGTTNNQVVIVGSGFVAGATINFEGGEGATPAASDVGVTSSQITATVSVKKGGAPRNRFWDVRVTNPDGSTAVLVRGLTVAP